MSDQPEHRVGEVVGKYRISRFLAAGGMGAVYEAQHTLVKRRFAVKFLHRELARKRDLLARFQREAEAAGALESENVAAAIDLGVATDGSPYIVMEYLVGESLEHLLERDGTLPVERAADLVQQACRGVQAAHGRGIVHRDLKPHNLFVCRREDGTDLVKVLDFGVAKLEALEQNSAATRTGTVLGTPSYMSPEQARGEKTVGHAADVYALGAILYELLSGKKPHPGDSHNAILHHISTQPAVALAQVTEGLPSELIAVVMKTLEGRVEDRPESAEALAQALAPWVEHKRWPAPDLERATPSHVESSSTELAPAFPERAPPAPSLGVASLDRERTPSAKPPWMLIGAGGIAVAVAVLLLRPGGTATPSETSASPAVAAPSPVTASPPVTAELAAPPSEPTPPSLEPATSASPEPEPPKSPPGNRNVVASPDSPRTPSPARRSAPAEPRAVPPVAKPGEKSSPPGESAASPVNFDKNNPYH